MPIKLIYTDNIKYLGKWDRATEFDISVVASQIERTPRGMIAVAARAGESDALGCSVGEPIVVLTAPRVEKRTKNNNGNNDATAIVDVTNDSINVDVKSPKLPSEQLFEPFPTLFYLTNPKYAAALSKLEATGFMKELTKKITVGDEKFDKKIAENYQEAHKYYISLRDKLALELGIEPLTSTHADFSAGGMPNRVKCLHALVGYALACPGICEIGEIAYRKISEQE